MKSKPLQVAHQKLWSKKLPNGQVFELRPIKRNQLQWGELRLSSDSISNSYINNLKMRPVVEQAKGDAEELFRWGSKIGAYILFPAYRVEGKSTINGARGMHTKVGDRMDLTLEAIRRYFSGEESPLSDTLIRYKNFFDLFVNFEGYVDFWLLNDLVDKNYQVKFFLKFDSYRRNAVPVDVNEYIKLKNATVKFLTARTERITS